MPIFRRDSGNEVVQGFILDVCLFDHNATVFLTNFDGIVRLQAAAASVAAGIRTAALLPHFLTCWFIADSVSTKYIQKIERHRNSCARNILASALLNA